MDEKIWVSFRVILIGQRDETAAFVGVRFHESEIEALRAANSEQRGARVVGLTPGQSIEEALK